MNIGALVTLTVAAFGLYLFCCMVKQDRDYDRKRRERLQRIIARPARRPALRLIQGGKQ